MSNTITDQQEPRKRFSLRDSFASTRFVYRYLKPYRWKFFFSIVALLLSSGTSLAFPWLSGLLIGVATNASQHPGWTLEGVAALAFGILVAQSLFSFIRMYSISEVAERSLADLRRDLFARMIRMPMNFFNASRVGELSSRISVDINTIHTTLTTTTAELIRQTIIMIGGLGLIIYTSPRLTLLVLVPIPLIVAIAVGFGRAIRAGSKRVQDLYAQLNVTVEETLQGIAVVKGFTAEQRETERYQHQIADIVGVSLKVARSRGAFISFIIFILFGGITGVIWYGGTLVQTGQLSIGALATFILYAVFVGGAMGSFADLYSSIQRAVGASQRARELLLDEEIEALEREGEQAIHEGDIEFRNVRFRYATRPDIEVIRGISFAVPAGSSIAFVGASGGGKSTIAALLARLYEPESGIVAVGGRDAHSYPLGQYREAIGIVPQEITLFGGTIAENIGYGKEGATEAEITEAARLANAHDFITGFPEGYATIVGERGVRLSGGQRQRIAIARAIIKNPAILVLDEATSFLDAESEHAVQEALRRVMQGRTTVIIAHRLSTIRHAATVAVMAQGEIVELGTYAQLIAADGRFARLVRLQQQMGEDVLHEELIAP
ncbi:MAG: ABC transporter ATP-binding protein [Chlorobi bacterium]|nr:ABC transporter ATP-binding protein [Chlorobiota bacterium]MBX7217681.1 ABC transporter ATP-binding protein/permease [Candidatus Kapabacteria bacterium]